jgi:hypothetical protein
MGDNRVSASPDAIVGNAEREVSLGSDEAVAEDSSVVAGEALQQTSSEQVGIQGLGTALRKGVVPSYGTRNGHSRSQTAFDAGVNWRGLEVSD